MEKDNQVYFHKFNLDVRDQRREVHSHMLAHTQMPFLVIPQIDEYYDVSVHVLFSVILSQICTFSGQSGSGVKHSWPLAPGPYNQVRPWDLCSLRQPSIQ